MSRRMMTLPHPVSGPFHTKEQNGAFIPRHHRNKPWVWNTARDYVSMYCMKLNRIHHIAIICRDYEKSKRFYTEILDLQIEQEIYRAERDSYKLDLSLNGQYLIELFSFPDPPHRVSHPEAAGLRHMAFEVDDIEEWVFYLRDKGITPESLRIDEFTQKRYTFFSDPDDLPIELYER